MGALFGTLRSITDGLKPGERVIVNGMQSAQSGAKVIPHEVAVPTESVDAMDKIAATPPPITTAYKSDSQPSAKARQ